MEAPTKPNPPPPREVSLTRTLGRRIKMLRRTWSITKGSLGRMRSRTTVDDEHSCEESKESSNDHSNLDGGRYFSFARHFKKNVTGPFSTFYLNGYTTNDDNESTGTTRDSSREPMYSNTNKEVGKLICNFDNSTNRRCMYPCQFSNSSRCHVRSLQRICRSGTSLSILRSSHC